MLCSYFNLAIYLVTMHARIYGKDKVQIDMRETIPILYLQILFTLSK